MCFVISNKHFCSIEIICMLVHINYLFCSDSKFLSHGWSGGYKFNYIPEIWNFGDVMVLVWTPPPHPPPPPPPPPPHAKACVSRNCDTNARIKFIIDIAIDTLEWKNPIDFGENRKTKMAAKRPFCENMMKKLVHSITSSKMHRSTSYLI